MQFNGGEKKIFHDGKIKGWVEVTNLTVSVPNVYYSRIRSKYRLLGFYTRKSSKNLWQPCCDIRKEVAMAAVLQQRNLIPNTEPPAGKSFKDLIKQVSAIVKPHSI